ncbi:MAG: hypothetical protein AUI50_06190 [Crenarchaeota archaeon 13_1_40CM_2_52_14]|nr:MAG: hypothetical protein AUI97_02920 [Crenarchaeota archaeon 13_1_40CM_3_52_17]OLD34496.1 MAG: hypothetical protein AUI50_06190 [Crenarchaeota archaeon 13_1_40CM_2_52_14]
MLFFDGEPASTAVVGTSILVKLQHLSLGIVELPSPLLKAPLKLNLAFHAAKLQDHPYHPRDPIFIPSQSQG